MAKFINVAAINGMIMERGEEPLDEALRQFNEAAAVLDGTGVDLVVTCETMMMRQPAGTGEDINDPGPRLTAYSEFAKRNKCVVAGASRIILDGKPRQSILYYGHDGELLGMYHKTFPTPQAIAKGTVPGDGAVVVDTPAGKLGGILCFDLNFDELRDEYIALAPDILCFSSYYNGGCVKNNWAVRTGAFMASALKDGCSEIIDPLGRCLNISTYYKRVAQARINLDRFVMHAAENADKFPDIRRKYKNSVLIDEDSPLAFAVLYSCSDEFTALDIAKEYGLLSLEDYFADCRKLRSSKL
ncbi:MAG: carbon-nitrogen hydrolase family protein [Lentisphaeria bacterium]|nr:carbon-nitrogen hydrolase family protein [Lentisphaeria bacterium]